MQLFFYVGIVTVVSNPISLQAGWWSNWYHFSQLHTSVYLVRLFAVRRVDINS